MTAGWGGRVRPATHLCPGCRDVQVPNHLFCCTSCWGQLSRETQREIYRTAKVSHLHDRSLAIQAARREWNDAKPAMPSV